MMPPGMAEYPFMRVGAAMGLGTNSGQVWGLITVFTKKSESHCCPYCNRRSRIGTYAEGRRYFSELTSVLRLVSISEEQEIWTLQYTLPAPISNRVFTVLITTFVETDSTTGLRTGWVISVPADVSSDKELRELEPQMTRGRYASIERIQELAGGTVNWRSVSYEHD